MIELGKLPGSIVKQFPETLHFRIKFAAASLAFILITFLLAGSVDEVRVGVHVQEEAVPVYLQTAEEEQIDYEEFLNRIPLRKPAPNLPILDWFSENRRKVVFS